MAQSITLTKDELALIEQRRAEEKAKAAELLKSYDYYKENKIEAEKQTVLRLEADAEARKKVFEDFLSQLLAVSPEFKLDCKIVKLKRQLDLYDIDDNGREIKFNYDKDGLIKSHIKPKEKINFEYCTYNLVLSYTGKLPDNYEYYVIPVSQNSKYSGRVTGYKMQIQGTGINSWEKTGQMTKPESIVKKLKELSESAFRQVEYAEAERLRKNRVEDEFKKQYGYLEKEATVVIEDRTFTITFKNGIQLVVNGYIGGRDEVIFSHSKLKLPYDSLDISKLIEGLKNV